VKRDRRSCPCLKEGEPMMVVETRATRGGRLIGVVAGVSGVELGLRTARCDHEKLYV
jgi:hypothetical protein